VNLAKLIVTRRSDRGPVAGRLNSRQTWEPATWSDACRRRNYLIYDVMLAKKLVNIRFVSTVKLPFVFCQVAD